MLQCFTSLIPIILDAFIFSVQYPFNDTAATYNIYLVAVLLLSSYIYVYCHWQKKLLCTKALSSKNFKGKLKFKYL